MASHQHYLGTAGLRYVTVRLLSATGGDLVRLAPTLARIVGEYPTSRESAHNLPHKIRHSEDGFLLKKLCAQVKSLLHDKTLERQYVGLVLAKALLEIGTLEDVKTVASSSSAILRLLDVSPVVIISRIGT